jgi:CRP-like cAMP-binding protein
MPSQFHDLSIYIGKSAHLASKPVDLMSGLTEAEREAVLALGRIQTYAQGEQIFSQGEPQTGILIIIEGEVRSYHVAPSGREITLAYWAPGHFVGGPEIFGGNLHSWSGEATRDCRILHLVGDVLRQIMLSTPQFALNVVDALVFKASCFSSLLQFVGTRPAGQTLAHLLIILAQNHTPLGEGEVLLDQRYTQDKLAKMIGTTRQWVATTLSRMKRDKLLDVVNARIRIRDIERLRCFAEAG